MNFVHVCASVLGRFAQKGLANKMQFDWKEARK